jgi:hypothetical protein
MCLVGFSAEIARACFVTGISVKDFRRRQCFSKEMGLARWDQIRWETKMKMQQNKERYRQ